MANISDGNYTGLVDSCKSWLHRADLASTDYDNFIYLFESDFNREMRVRQMEAETTIGITSGYLPNPSDWREWQSIHLIQGQAEIAIGPLTDENAAIDYGYSYLSDPRGYVVRGDKTYIYPQPGSGAWSYRTRYSQGVPRLTSSATTNWLLTAHPTVYLQGVLYWAGDWMVDDQKQMKYKQLLTETLDKIKIESDRAKYSGGVPTMRPDRFY
jgi:hypothetical protein